MINLCMIGTTLSNNYIFSLVYNGKLSLICVYRFFTNVYYTLYNIKAIMENLSQNNEEKRDSFWNYWSFLKLQTDKMLLITTSL